jgi:N-acetylglucosaminyldiphosphoundecaprenol N-acetyl-beta-D-mannosaminyltransferase
MMISGVKVDPVLREQAIARIGLLLDESRGHFVTTPNPEIILHARKHAHYRDILNKADLALPDGFGLILVSRLMGEPLKERVSGSDMVPQICRLAREKKLRIALMGGLDEKTVTKAAEIMRGWGNEIVFAHHGPSKEEWDNKPIHDKILDELIGVRPHIILVGLGHPKQEEWIDRFRGSLPSVRLFLGCGGSLDFIAEARRRAPKPLRRIGLEWLWRLITEPRRWKRILNAVIVFPSAVIYESFRKK